MEVTEPQIAVVPGRQDGELTVAELCKLWGYRRSRVWEMLAKENVIPYRQDRNRIYVQRSDAERYLATLPATGRRPSRKGPLDD